MNLSKSICHSILKTDLKRDIHFQSVFNIQKIKNMQMYWTDFNALGFEGPAMLATAKNDEGTPWRAIPLIRMHWCVKKRWNVYLSTFQLKGSTMLSKTPKTCSQIMLTSHFPISQQVMRNSRKILLLHSFYPSRRFKSRIILFQYWYRIMRLS